MGSYPGMCAAILPLISIFHGPQAEGSFSAMGDIIDVESCRTDVETYSAIQTVKYGLRARKATAVSLIIIIIMYIYHALINALNAHMIHINLNTILSGGKRISSMTG